MLAGVRSGAVRRLGSLEGRYRRMRRVLEGREGGETGVPEVSRLMNELNRNRMFDRTTMLWEKMFNRKCRPDGYSCLAAMKAYSNLGQNQVSLHIFRHIAPDFDVEPSLVLYNSAINAAAKMGQQGFSTLMELYTEVRDHPRLEADGFTYSSAIHGCATAGEKESAVQVYSDMVSSGLQPDVFTYESLLRVFMAANDVDACYIVLEDMEKRETTPDAKLYKRVLTFYCWTGDKEAAGRTYTALGELNGCTMDVYTMYLGFCIEQGLHEEAAAVHQEMETSGARSNYDRVLVDEWRMRLDRALAE